LSGGALAALAICWSGRGRRLEAEPRAHRGLPATQHQRARRRRAGRQGVRKNGVDPAAYRHATLFLDNSDAAANEFLREKNRVAAINKLYESQIPVALWGTRYFKDSEPEEYFVVLKSDGSLHSIHHTIAEARRAHRSPRKKPSLWRKNI